MRTLAQLSRPAAGLLLLLHTAGCYTWGTPHAITPTQHIMERRPSRVRLTVAPDSASPRVESTPMGPWRVELTHPWMAGDSVWGYELRSPARGASDGRASTGPIAVARVHIQRLEVRELSPEKTVLASLGIAASALAAATIAWLATWDGPMGTR